MDGVLAYQIVQFALLGVFALAISDVRRKKDMVASMHRGLIIALKCVYAVPLLIYGSCLLSVDVLGWYDLPSLLVCGLGTYLAVRGKVDLGRHHAWTGYRRENTQIVKSGIYAYVRHPIYLGIVVFVLGGLSTAIPRISLVALLAGAVTVIYILAFLAVAARREARSLTIAHGDDYADYKQQVHPFLPVRRYRQAA